MAALCAGGAVGAAFNESQTVVINAIETTARFKSSLKRLQATMRAISPIFEDVKRLDILLGSPEEVNIFTEQLKNATDLIGLCSKIKQWNIYKMYVYSKKIQSFENSLIRFFQIDGQALQVRDIKQNLVGVSNLSDQVYTIKEEILPNIYEKLDSNSSSIKQIWTVVSDLSHKLDTVQEMLLVLADKLDSINLRKNSSSIITYSGSSCVAELPEHILGLELPELILGLDLPLKKVKVMLIKDNKVVVQAKNSSSLPVVVVLSAPPGCGKTTLAKMVCLDSEIIGTFKENIFFVTVSKTVNIKVIVQRVFQQKGCLDELLEVQSNEDTINQLGQLLRKIGGGPNKDPILLVLDDVWSPGLESLIHKFMFKGIPGYKILVTSRFDPHKFQNIYRLKLLNHQDVTRLFCHSAFPPGSSHPHVSSDLVNEIVKACKGFPLALNVVALSLCGKPEATWKITLTKWSTGRSNIFDSNNELLNNLKTSLDALDDEKGMDRVKDCFLDLGSFPEDQRIPATVLLDMWVELYDDLDEEGMYTYDNINELSTRNLLNLVPISKDDSSDLGGYCNGQFVTQHDMLRELAIHQCSQEAIELRKRLIIEIGGNSLPKELEQPLHARLVSISTDDSFTSSWYDMQLPKAEVLILNLRTRNYTLPQFIKLMDKLKVLIVTNYGFCPAELNNFSVVGSLSGIKRIRLEHVSISSSLGTAFAFKLMSLKKISLTMCEIGNSLDKCANMFPNLVEIEIEYCRDLIKLPVGLCDNIHLQKISISSCNELRTLPEEIGRLINLQSLRLNSCTKLERLPETIGYLQKLNLLDVSDCLTLTEMPKRMGDLHGLRTLNMRGCSGLSVLPQSVEELKNLMVFCDKQTSLLWSFYKNMNLILVKEDINLNWLHN